MMFIWVFVIIGVVWYLSAKPSSPKRDSDHASSHARELLDQRFARGEIDESIYQNMKKQIEEDEK